MSLIVITGGARSGKSSAAEALAAARGRRVVVAVGGRADDPEMAWRIAAHRAGRPDGFEVREVDADPGWVAQVAPEDVLLVECVGTLLGRVALEETGDAPLVPDGAYERAWVRARALLDALCARDGDTVVVTNEVGDGLVPPSASGRLFRDLMGSANKELVSRADAAWLAVAGRFVSLSGAPTAPPWPEMKEC